MRVSLLGELEVLDAAGRPVVLTGAKQRILLAVLALRAGRLVSADQLVEAVWGQDPPPAVRNGLQGLVSKLRRALGSPGVVVLRGGGYVLDVAPEAVDVHRFEQLVARGRAAAAAGDRESAVARFVEGEALWRGEALADFAYDDFATATAARLHELRLEALEDRFDAELQLGRTGLGAALDALVAAHPLRERLRGLSMVALYRAGRQANALAVYRDGRRVLAEELGLDPGPELRRLEAAVLAQDPSLDGPGDTTPAAGEAPTARFEVPMPLTPLVGRATDVAAIARLVDEARAVTLIGPGGVGKTRLALEVARRVGRQLADGACLVELAAVGDPAAVPAAVASALGVTDPDRLPESVGARELLVVLDNCEHVIAAAAALAEDLLRHCPRARVLATSREGLRIPGEAIRPVAPLLAGDAVSLFVARATAAGALLDELDETSATDDTDEAIAEICARLDGLPLAIELAAARARALPLDEIRSRLDDRFRLLTGGARTALPRQQTLRAVVDWSYDLLADDEQRVFTRLSVFPGGCDLATAQAVCADEHLDALDVADVVQALVDKSLVTVGPGRSGVRYGELQTLAQYGHERLAERGELAAARNAMAARYAALGAESPAAFVGSGQERWLIAMSEEQDNLRAALEWAVATGEAETALTIAGGASWAHWLAGTASEARRWLDLAFASAGDVTAATRALALAGRALVDFQLGRGDAVDADLEAALDLLGHHGDVDALAFTHTFYAEVAMARGDLGEARRRRRDLLAFHATLPDEPFTVAIRTYSTAKLAALDDDLATAERCYRTAAVGLAESGRPMMHAMCLGMVADFDERAHDHAAAARVLETAIAINDRLGLRGFNGALLARLGWDRLHLGDTAGADAAYGRALELARPLHNRPVIFHALVGLAAVHRLAGRHDDARGAARDALELHLAGGPRRLANRVDAHADVLTSAATACAVLAGVMADAGDDHGAARLLGHAARLRAEAGTTLPAVVDEDVRRALAGAEARLGTGVFHAEFERGQHGELPADLTAPR